MKEWKIYIIPHTHWDREWYFTKSTANTFLHFNLKKIFKEYEAKKDKFSKFVYDSQYSVVDDYLKLSPKDESRIAEMVKNNKLVISPWYTQTDTFNVTGESILRNMLTGIKESEKYGNYMRIAYMPDSFGFNSNLPQLFSQFNMKAFIHWRGVKEDDLEKGVFNKWRGIDGTELNSYNMFKYGYTCGGRFTYDLFREGYDKEDVKNNAKKILDSILNDKEMNLLNELKEMSKNSNKNVLFPWGSDQITYFENIELIVDEMNKLDSQHEWIISSYEEFIDIVTEETKDSDKKILTGELKHGQYSRVHKTINSARYDIKFATKNLEYLIYKIAEPLSLIYEKMGGDYPHDLIQFSQRLLFECQAHDSVGGCNSDFTNNNIIERIASATDNIKSLITLIQRQLSYQMKLSENDLVIFNLEPKILNQYYEMTIFTRKKHFKITDQHNNEINYTLISKDYVNADEFAIYNACETSDLVESENKECFFWTKIQIKIKDVKPMSISLLKIHELDDKPELKQSKINFIENDFYKVTLENNKVNILDKKRNKQFDNVLSFEANADKGDLYDYSPENWEETIISKLKTVEIISNKSYNQDLPRLSLKYLYDVDIQKSSQELNVDIYLDNCKVNLEVNTINNLFDIRWRVLFNTDVDGNDSYCDTSFGKIKHNKSELDVEKSIYKKQEWNDYPIDIETLESTCWKKNDKFIFAVFSKHNNEYQLKNDSVKQIAITMFRGVSYIGRNNLLYRPNRASGNSVFPMPTPNGNIKNKNLTFKYAIKITDNDQKIVADAKRWCIENTYYQVQKINLFEKNGDMFVLPTTKLKSYNNDLISTVIDNRLVVSCLKKSYDLSKNILRIYNPTDEEIDISIIDLKEVEVLEKLEKNKSLSIKPNEFKTFEF